VRARAAVACALLLALASRNSIAIAQTPETRSIDPAKSKAQFSVKHVFVERVTGTIPILGGELKLVAGSAVPASVSAVLDAKGVNSGDADRDKSLNSDDYFDTDKFPTWTFVSSAIAQTGPASFTMDGTLTIHGVAQPEHLTVTIAGDAEHPLYHAIGKIDRHAFGMRGARLDPAIGNPADVTLDIALK
jgi:polyisoprenoid-binding protein YceI